MEHGSRTRLLSAVVIAVVFGAGILIGFAADSSLEAETAAAAPEEVVAEDGERDERRAPLYTRLEPSPDQQAAIDSIVTVHRERTNALDKETRRSYRAEFRGILLETREAIKGVFPAEQAQEYQRLLDEWDAQQAAEREDPDRRK